MKPTDDSRLMNRLIANELIQDSFSYLSYLYPNSAHDFSFLSPTVQGELSRQPRCQPPRSTLGYPIQSTSLFDQAFLSISDHLPGSIGNPKGLLDHLVGPGPSRSSALHGASWIPHYAGLPPSHKAGRPRPCSFIRRHHYFVMMEG